MRSRIPLQPLPSVKGDIQSAVVDVLGMSADDQFKPDVRLPLTGSVVPSRNDRELEMGGEPGDLLFNQVAGKPQSDRFIVGGDQLPLGQVVDTVETKRFTSMQSTHFHPLGAKAPELGLGSWVSTGRLTDAHCVCQPNCTGKLFFLWLVPQTRNCLRLNAGWLGQHFHPYCHRW